MIPVTPAISIDEREIRMVFVRSSGPGGQNVNKVSTAVQLRFDAMNSPSLPEAVRNRLIHLAGKRISGSGILMIEARRYRTQERNRQDALDRLVALIRKAAERPKTRIKTRPSSGSKKRRVANKLRRSETKRMRRPVEPHDA